MKRLYLALTCCLVAVAFVSATASAAMLADERADYGALMRQDTPDAGVGSYVELHMRHRPNTIYSAYSLVGWDLSSVMPSGSPRLAVTDVTLTLTQSAKDGLLDLYMANGPWDEDTVSWNTQPNVPFSTDPNEWVLVASAPIDNGTYTFTGSALDQVVEDWVNGAAPNYGLYIRSGAPVSNVLYRVWSDDAAPELQPRLEFTTAEMPEPTTLVLFGLASVGLAWRRRRTG